MAISGEPDDPPANACAAPAKLAAREEKLLRKIALDDNDLYSGYDSGVLRRDG
jgi:hypothetical protein